MCGKKGGEAIHKKIIPENLLWQLAFQRGGKRGSPKWKPQSFCNPVAKVTAYQFCSSLPLEASH